MIVSNVTPTFLFLLFSMKKENIIAPLIITMSGCGGVLPL
jgi:hypothetical protein